MKKMKKLLALLIAMAMVFSMSTMAFAADPADNSITISGLAAGDNVKYYKVVEWTDNGWAFVEPFATALTDDEQKEVIGYEKVVSVDPDTGVATKEVVAGKITDETAAKMAAAAASIEAIVTAGDTLAEGSTSWTKTEQAPGLYMALITGAAPTADNDMVIYNPAFVAVQADNTGTAIALPLNYADSGTAKMSTITVDKTAKDDEDPDEAYAESTTQNVGDIIDFKVVVTVPAYLENWKDPVFTVTDTLTTGLTLAVKDGEGDDALSDITVVGATNGTLTSGEENDYTVVKTTGGYTITFTDSYLKGRAAAEAVTITYKAKITAEAASVNPETNTVKIEYSKNPTTASDHGTKEDKTTHYTFSIDASLFGDEEYITSELIKVGVDAAGNPVTEEKEYSNSSKHNPLQGAEFKLYTDAQCTKPYTNSTITADTVFTSDENGLLNITGLDEGTYYLKETKPATGYQLLTDIISYTITATYTTVAATDTCNAYQELSGYTVRVNDGATSTYVFENGTIKKDNGVAGDQSTEIKNTQGTSLPSTGGIGTTIFYTVGSLLVIGAGVILITRRRMNVQ